VRPQHTSRTRADSIHISTERPPRVSLDCFDLGGSGSVHTLSVTCSAAFRRTPLPFDTGDHADTCPPLATTQCGQQSRGQRRSDLRKVAHSLLPITLPVGKALARWQLTSRGATRSGLISPFQTVGPTLVGMLLAPGLMCQCWRWCSMDRMGSYGHQGGPEVPLASSRACFGPIGGRLKTDFWRWG